MLIPAHRVMPMCRLLLAIVILLNAWVCWQPAEAAVSINEGSRTYVVRQGYQQLASFPGNHAACEADAKTRTARPLTNPTRTFQIKTGRGLPLTTLTTLEACLQGPRDRLNTEGQTRTSGGNVLSCVVTTKWESSFQPPTCVATFNFIASFKPNTTPPVCPPNPASRPQACPDASLGTWEQIATTAPNCTVTWSSAPKPNECQPVELPPLPAPLNIRAAMHSTTQVKLEFDLVPDALAYVWEHCRGSTCTNYATPTCIAATTNSPVTIMHTLPLDATARYRARASRSRDCLTALGVYSAPVTGTTVQPPPVIETACTGRVCQLTWQHTGPVADYFRFWWGQTSAELGTIEVNSVVANGSRRETTLTMPANGPYYFGGKAFIGGNASVMSNIIRRDVQ